MEIIKTETRQTISVSGDDLKGVVDILNGHIDECIISLFSKDNGDVTVNLTESQVRQLAKEFKDIIDHIDGLDAPKSPERGYIDTSLPEPHKEEPMLWEE